MNDLIATWSPLIGPLVAAVAVLGLPGLALGFFLRLRGWWLAAAAAPLSVSLIAVTSIVAGFAGVGYGPLPVAALTAIACLAAWAWSRWVAPADAGDRTGRVDARSIVTAVVAVAIPAVIVCFTVLRATGDPTHFAQRFDNFFHLNAVQYVLDTGNASPFSVGLMTQPTLTFYPSAWHALVALVVLCSGASVVVATNAVICVVAALVWPLSAILLTRTLVGSAPAATIAAGVVSAALPTFPLLLLHYGVLYPLLLGLAAAPVLVAAIVVACRSALGRRRWTWLLLVVLLVPGVAVAHPGALIAVLALSVPTVVVMLVRIGRERRTVRAWAVIALIAAACAALGLVVLAVVRPPAQEIYWPITSTVPAALREVFTASVYGYTNAWVVAALIAIGLVTALVRPREGRLIALGMFLVVSALYVIVAGSPVDALRDWVTGPWYNNPPRLAAIWALGAVPIAALGAGTVWALAAAAGRRVFRGPASVRRVLAAVVAVAVVIGFVVTTQRGVLSQARQELAVPYQLDPQGPILTRGEFDLMMRLADDVPADAVIGVDPWSGAGFAYALSGRKVLSPHLLMYESDDAHEINTSFAEAATSPEMCAALAATGVEYLLVFDRGDFENGGSPSQKDFRGIDDVTADNPSVRLVDSEPGARLYQITSCGLAG